MKNAIYILCAAWLVSLAAEAKAQPKKTLVNVLTHHQDARRSGTNLKETDLTVEKLKNNQFGKKCFRLVNGNLYAQPLVVTQAEIAGSAGPRNVVIVATEHNSVYAFDADDTDQNSKTAQLWQTDQSVLGAPIPSTTLSEDLTKDDPGSAMPKGPGVCVDLTTEIGITSTPFILLTKADPPKKGLIFVVAKSLGKDHQYSFKIHVLQLADGKPAGQPVTIEGEVPGSGLASKGGKLTFTPLIQHNRAALLIDGNTLYVAFCGHCDRRQFHGWLFAYDISDPTAPRKLDVFCTTPNIKEHPAVDGEGGIWMSGQGPASDGKGNIYLSTGNGSYDGTTDFGDSVIRFRLEGGKIRLKDHFTPRNELELKDQDADLGSAGPSLLPDSNLLIAGGKEGRLYLIDIDKMGTSLQDFQATRMPAKKPKDQQVPPKNPADKSPDLRYWNIHGAPIAWNSQKGFFVYVCGEEDPIKAYQLVPAAGAGGWRFTFTPPAPNPPTAFSDESAPYPGFPRPDSGSPSRREDVWMPGGILTLSANGDDPTSGILWVNMPLDGNANQRVVHGVLRAFDAANFAARPGGGVGVPKQLVQIYSTVDNNQPNDSLGMYAKYVPPTVANGKVYMAANQEELPVNSPGEPHQVEHEGEPFRPGYLWIEMMRSGCRVDKDRDQSACNDADNFPSASFSIWRTRSRVRPSDSPISLRVFGGRSLSPNRILRTVASRLSISSRRSRTSLRLSASSITTSGARFRSSISISPRLQPFSG